MVEYELCILLQEFYVYDILKKFLDYCREREEKIVEVRKGTDIIRISSDDFDLALEKVDAALREEGEHGVEVRPDKLPCTLVFTFDGFAKILGLTRNVQELEHKFEDFKFFSIADRSLFEQSGVALANQAKRKR